MRKILVPFAVAYRLDDLPLMVYEDVFFRATIKLTGKVAVRLAQQVPLSSATNRGLETLDSMQTERALEQLFPETKISWDKKNNQISYRSLMVTKSATPQAPSTALGTEVSLVMNGSDFPAEQWSATNDPEFKYLTRPIDVVRAAAAESRRDPRDAPSWYQAGFVDDYGIASMENDYNMYAELAMSHPERLKQLADQYPRIKAKTRILARFYSNLAPEMKNYFEQSGLNFDE